MPKSTDSHITKSTTPEAEVLVRVEGVSKKFCKDLKRSLWYGIQDITSELFGLKKKEGLRKDEFWAVSEVSFELKRGECLGLIGHNGAGKSTLLKILNGLIKPDKGKITMKGRIAALIELGAGFNPILTGRENVFNNGAVLGFSQKEIAAKYNDIVEFAELEEFMDTPVQNYSSGMKVRLGFAVAAQMEPDVLIIDEVLAVGDIGFRLKCFNAIGKILQNAVVILVSHSMPQIARVSTHCILLTDGVIGSKSEDIGYIIQKYYERFENSGTNTVGDIISINEVKVHKIDSRQKEGEVEYGKDMVICLGVKSYQQINDLSIGLTFLDKEQKNIASTSLNKLGLEKGCNQFKVKLRKVRFMAGSYTITTVFSQRMESMQMNKFLGRIDNCASFQVINCPTINGSSFLLESELL